MNTTPSIPPKNVFGLHISDDIKYAVPVIKLIYENGKFIMEKDDKHVETVEMTTYTSQGPNTAYKMVRHVSTHIVKEIEGPTEFLELVETLRKLRTPTDPSTVPSSDPSTVPPTGPSTVPPTGQSFVPGQFCTRCGKFH